MCSLPQTPFYAFLNPADGSRGIVNVQPSNANNNHRSNSPNNVNMKIDSNVNIPVSSNHFAEFIRSAKLGLDLPPQKPPPPTFPIKLLLGRAKNLSLVTRHLSRFFTL